MRKLLLPAVALISTWLSSAALHAQNVAPFWSLGGNSNANAASKLGTTNNIPLRLLTNNAERMRIDAAGKVGIGTTAPNGKLTVFGSGSNPAASWVTSGIPVFAGFGENVAGNADHILAMASNAPNARPVFLGRRSRGTLNKPAAVQTNDYLASLFASGYDGSTFQSPATVDFFADANAFAGNVPTRISLSTGSNFGNRIERLKVLSNGNIDINNGDLFVNNGTGYTGFGTNAPANRIHVKQAIPNRAIEWEHESLADFWTVGIGTNTLNCRFEFNGVLRGSISSADGSFLSGSDKRLKEDIEPMTDLLEKLVKLKPSRYYYKDGRALAKHKSLGFIAQEVEPIFPEVVYDGDGNYKMLNYQAFAVIAVKAIQEQQLQINALQKVVAQNDSLRAEVADLRRLVMEIKNGGSGMISAALGSLDQTSPNPARGTTTVRYYIGEAAGAAKLVITNASGQLIKDIQLNNRGRGQIDIDTHTLAAGIYNYTLYVDANRVDSKRLVIAR